MKDILQDIVSHVLPLGVLPLLKFETDSNQTCISSVTENLELVFNAEMHARIPEFKGVFGIGNLEKLNLHLKNPEYQQDAKIEVIREKNEDGTEYPSHIHFENVLGDFKNDYRFFNQGIIEQRLKSSKFKGATWDIEFEPPVSSITRMKLMTSVYPEHEVFSVKTVNDDLIFSFGDASDHAGEFIFKKNVKNPLTIARPYPAALVQSILSLSGNSFISISNQGIIRITLDSGLALYNYYILSFSK